MLKGPFLVNIKGPLMPVFLEKETDVAMANFRESDSDLRCDIGAVITHI
jgi:hypothetical protein